jgi:hypothetical protein
MMEHLTDAWGDVLAWTAVLAAVVACAGFAARIGRPGRTAAPVTKIVEVAAVAEVSAAAEVPAIAGPRRLDPAREWGLVILRATLDLERPAALAALQAEAGVKIAAAEHAYNRLVDDCANLCPTSATPTVVPPPQRVAVPRAPPLTRERWAERRPLAA